MEVLWPITFIAGVWSVQFGGNGSKGPSMGGILHTAA
jgi:hypothetical protein